MAAYKRDSLVRRVIDFLQANPGEELTRGDIAVKFGVDPAAIDSLLAIAVRNRRLLMTRNAEDGVTWKLAYSNGRFPGPVNGTADPTRRQRSPMVDLSKVVIEKGIPIVEAMKRKNHWRELFDRMEPGDSFAVPNGARMALAHAQAQYRKSAQHVVFATRKVSDTQTRIWRTA